MFLQARVRRLAQPHQCHNILGRKRKIIINQNVDGLFLRVGLQRVFRLDQGGLQSVGLLLLHFVEVATGLRGERRVEQTQSRG